MNMEYIPIGKHKLPPLPYAYDALEPIISEQTLHFHHDVHHKTYVDDLNKTELDLQAAREKNNYAHILELENKLSFNGSGHILHSLYWTNMATVGHGGSLSPTLASMIKSYFGTPDAFKAQFITATLRVQGSGWGILVYNPAFGRLEILQCEKHQNFTLWGVIPLLVCDVWEHAYYLDYHYDRTNYINKWWQLVDWISVSERMAKHIGGE